MNKMNDEPNVEERWASLGRPQREYLGGSMNRVIRLAARAGEVRAAVEDDFHHFRVAVLHDGEKVVSVLSQAYRTPYSLCGDAGARLRELVGAPLVPELTALTLHIDARAQCTHQFDLACLAVAMAARGAKERTYHAAVHDSRNAQYLATLDRDGRRVMQWSMEGEKILSPAPYGDRSIGSGFTGFVSRELQGDDAEAALVLRRAVFITSGRGIEHWADSLDHAMLTGGCWVQQSERHRRALRNKGTTLDFTGEVDQLTASDRAWLDWSEEP
jgi:hypothetical protein